MISLGGFSVPGPRPYNEDNYLIKDLSAYSSQLGGVQAFLMVCDGMGGHQGGDVASRVAAEAAERYVDDLVELALQSKIALDVNQALREIASEASAAVIRAAEAAGGSNMGSTLVAAFVSQDEAWIGHIGDSRAYLIQGSDAQQITVDHSQVGRMIAEGILTEEQAQNHPSRNVIERALGFGDGDVELNHENIGPADVLVLCSDGLSTVLAAADLVSVSASAADAGEAASRLTDAAVKAGTDDNTTVVLYCPDWSMFRARNPQARTNRRAASKARREAARHVNANRASWIIAGVIGGLVVLIWAVAVLNSGGSGGAPPAGAVKSAASTTSTLTAPPKRSPDASGSQQPSSRERTYRVTGRDVAIRTAPTRGAKSMIGTLIIGAEFKAVEKRIDGKKWYVVSRPSIRENELTPAKGVVLAKSYPEPLYVDVTSNMSSIKLLDRD
ncbi:MAG: serine/threonine-protein phosphatase [Coriobacteriia bacterium]|nr:serine/threonine-protein phosphatase [Coriobacteriia bacterium]